MSTFATGMLFSTIPFDTDGTTFVLNNSPTCHICKYNSLFISEPQPMSQYNNINVSTAGGNVSPEGLGSIRI